MGGQMRIYLEVMWKHLYQRSFHMGEAQYMEQLDAVAELCSLWGCADEVREGIRDCKKRPVLDTVGAKAVQIPLQVPADVIEADRRRLSDRVASRPRPPRIEL